MSNKIKKFKEKHPKLCAGIVIGTSVVLSSTAAYFIGKKYINNVYGDFDTGRYIKKGVAKGTIFEGLTEGLLGYGTSTSGNFHVIEDDMFTECTMTSIKDSIDRIIEKGLATPETEAIMFMTWNSLKK